MSSFHTDVDIKLVLLLQVDPVHGIGGVFRAAQNDSDKVDGFRAHVFAGTVRAFQCADVSEVIVSEAQSLKHGGSGLAQAVAVDLSDDRLAACKLFLHGGRGVYGPVGVKQTLLLALRQKFDHLSEVFMLRHIIYIAVLIYHPVVVDAERRGNGLREDPGAVAFRGGTVRAREDDVLISEMFF